jgi:hypothetical protein
VHIRRGRRPGPQGLLDKSPLWNRWRHDTYKDKPEAELEYLDQLPAREAPATEAEKGKQKEEPEVKKYFTPISEEQHTIGGTGKNAGRVVRRFWQSRVVRLYYNWKYKFLCPTLEEVVKCYDAKHDNASE